MAAPPHATSLALFRSDNVAGVPPEMLAALRSVAEGDSPAYGDDAVTAGLTTTFAELFGRECTVVPVGTGTAANAFALSLLAGPLDTVVCHERAHVTTSESGAFEMFSGGAKLIGLAGENARLTPAGVRSFLDVPGSLTPSALTLTQGTEHGTLYRIDEITTLAELARERGMRVHMDGARFTNALVALGVSPADMTWRAGVDVLTFGATKNGTMNAEAIVIFDKTLSTRLKARQRRSGQLYSKMRFLSAQLEAYLANDLWLSNARRANAAARRLADGLAAIGGFEILFPVEINLIFVRIAEDALAALNDAGIRLHRNPLPGIAGNVFRLVTSFTTTDERIDGFLAACGRISR